MLKICYNICCGIDVHKKMLVATIATTNEHKVTTYQTKQFSTFTKYKCQYINEQKIKNKNVQILRLCNLSRFIFYFFYFVFYSIGSTCNVNNMRVMQ